MLVAAEREASGPEGSLPFKAGDMAPLIRRMRRFLADRDAAILLPEPGFTAARLGELLEEFAANREVLSRMAVNARGCATPNAAESVASLCMEAANA